MKHWGLRYFYVVNFTYDFNDTVTILTLCLLKPVPPNPVLTALDLSSPCPCSSFYTSPASFCHAPSPARGWGGNESGHCGVRLTRAVDLPSGDWFGVHWRCKYLCLLALMIAFVIFYIWGATARGSILFSTVCLFHTWDSMRYIFRIQTLNPNILFSTFSTFLLPLKVSGAA